MGPGIGLHGDIVLPDFADMVELSPAQRKAVMLVREGSSEQAPIELVIRNLFLYAIVTRSSDVHISGHGDTDRPSVQLSIRSPGPSGRQLAPVAPRLAQRAVENSGHVVVSRA